MSNFQTYINKKNINIFRTIKRQLLGEKRRNGVIICTKVLDEITELAITLTLIKESKNKTSL